MCSYTYGTCLFADVACTAVNSHVLCVCMPVVVKSPAVRASLLVSSYVLQGAQVGGFGNSGLILGSWQVIYGLCSQMPLSRKQVVPGLRFFFPGQDRDWILGENQPAFLFAGLGGLTQAPSEIQRRICG